MNSLSEVLQSPDPVNIEKFLGRVPAIFNIVIFSPHGYFGQADVLGLPDTGGQVHNSCHNPSSNQRLASHRFISGAGCLYPGSGESLRRRIASQDQAARFDDYTPNSCGKSMNSHEFLFQASSHLMNVRQVHVHKQAKPMKEVMVGNEIDTRSQGDQMQPRTRGNTEYKALTHPASAI